MKPVLTPAEASALDAASVERGVSIESLMERAGWEVARTVLDVTEGAYGRRAVVVCGRGHNAGDGFVAARHLDAAGARVSVVLVAGEPAGGSGTEADVSATNLSRLRDETRVRVVTGSEGLERELDRAEVVVDALVGTGLRGRVEGDVADAIEAINAAGVPVVAVDIPSGVNGTTGEVEGPAVQAMVTVAFGALKRGLVLHPGTTNAGAVEIVDIGFPAALVDADVGVTEASDISRLVPHRPPETNKRSSGTVLVIGGSRTMTGAVALAASSAYRAGAGLVSIATVESALPVVEALVPEATYIPLPETPDGSVAGESFKLLWDHMGSFDAFALGPGLGRGEETAEFARSFACASPAKIVIDADALNAFAGVPEELFERDPATAVLTPHAGEFARLVGRSADDAVDATRDRIEAVRGLAERSQQIVLLKGSRTAIGGYGMVPTLLEPIALVPSGELVDRHASPVRINATGSPALATAGSGDVLTGVIAGLLARGLASFDAATAAAYVHGLAGILAARDRGEGTTAGDISQMVPRAMREAGAA